ncbi:hypothetical protein GC097_30905 [Paenibacillus sp. LMG 31457]|uniref:LysR substrate-binding domain-containing protein n=1 Tax=Paenibacillus planticolens TaxID=2654976 RepID=A0ABX1ZWG9_9BACL|nr:hypothetical protein [Paenibacillus planticolens]
MLRMADYGVSSLGIVLQLKDEWFVGVKKGYRTRDLVDSVCQSAGFEQKYVYEGNEPARLTTLVEAGIGIGFIPCTGMNPREYIHYLQAELCL